jgi:uncharacterized protein (DUF58 family)
VSGSVRFGSGGRDGRTDKRLQMARVAGGLAYAALRTGDRVGLLTFSDRVHHFLPPRRSRGHAWQVIRSAFEQHDDAGGTDIGAALAYASKVLKRRAVVTVLSDFVARRPFAAELGALVRAHRTHALLFHDPREAALPGQGLVTLRDAETGELRVVDLRRVGAARGVEERLAELRRHGARASAVTTTDDAFIRLQQHFRGAR